MTKEVRYLAYLLRLWQVDDRGEMIWRASVEMPGAGERRGFASLDDLFEFLAVQTELEDDQDDCTGASVEF
ncbi:MAG TPA: hypothetical protein ENN19_04760 [Chloroflexi bacterium]|nr:hypothetical protein [Chloroflexota bacterium]